MTATALRRPVLELAYLGQQATWPPIVAAARGVAGRPRIVDVACGPARALAQLSRALPDAEYARSISAAGI